MSKYLQVYHKQIDLNYIFYMQGWILFLLSFCFFPYLIIVMPKIRIEKSGSYLIKGGSDSSYLGPVIIYTYSEALRHYKLHMKIKILLFTSYITTVYFKNRK